MQRRRNQNLLANYHIISFLLQIIFQSAHGQFPPHFLQENSVLAEPRVDCGVETITVWIRTERSFRGRLYVEDESENPECVRSYAVDGAGAASATELEVSPLPDSRGAEFGIRFGQCNMRRQRLLNPRGVTYSFTLVISFHPIFLTGIDRAFNIKCFFMEAVKALDATLDVSPLSTSVVGRDFTLPECAYHLKHGVDGPFMKYATIGEPITHVWQCDPVVGWLYGVLIHSCFVDDGHGNRFDLVDDRGCVTDRSLLAEIAYNEKSFTAYAHTHVFRYADRVQLFFTCTVQLCFREDGGCEGISPPHCLDKKGGPPPTNFPTPPAVGPPPFTPFLPPPYPPITLSSKSPGLHFRPPNGPTTSHLHHHLHHSFGVSPPSKDSPLATATKSNESIAVNQKLLSDDIFIYSNHSRAGRKRNAGGIELGGRMETDLSADLTVVPRTTVLASANMNTDTESKGGDRKMQQSADERNPFVRVLPTKSDEYGGDPVASFSTLDSQKFSSFEVLAIASASLIATITVTSLITTFCLQRCRLRKLLTVKINKMGIGRGEMIIA